MRNASFVTLLFLFSACSTTTLTEKTKNDIARCNAGMSVTLSADVEGKLQENIRDGIKIDASLGNELRGLLMNSDKITATNIDSMYAQYLQCLSM